MAERPRLFIAVWPSAEVCDRLDALARPSAPGVRYTRRDQWHVTLRFIGAGAADEARAALESVDAPAAVARCGPVVSRLGRDAVVVPVAGLAALACAVITATAGLGAPPGPRGFAGHLTLARLKGRAVCAMAGARFSASFAVPEIALVRSDPGPEGVRYTTIAVHPLRKASGERVAAEMP